MEKRLVNVMELSELLKININTLYSWVNQGKIPYVKLNRLVRFDLVKINKWLETNSKRAEN